MALRDLARECAADESAQLLTLASKFHDLRSCRPKGPRSTPWWPQISFVDASPREVREVRRELKAPRKLAA